MVVAGHLCFAEASWFLSLSCSKDVLSWETVFYGIRCLKSPDPYRFTKQKSFGAVQIQSFYRRHNLHF